MGLSFLPKEQREPLEKDVEDMNLLLNEFLDFAKFENEQDVPAEDTNPSLLVDDLIENYSRTDVKIQKVGEIPNISIKLKPFAIKRALENLINNANRYGDQIFIEKKIENNCLIFSVHDDGPGIDESQHDESCNLLLVWIFLEIKIRVQVLGLVFPLQKKLLRGTAGG